MVAVALCADPSTSPVADPFLDMLPAIERAADRAFRHLRAEAREELVAEAVAIALRAFRRLVELRKTALAFPTVLAKFAIRHVRHGRGLGRRLNAGDVTSHYCRRKKAVRVQSLHRQTTTGCWEEVVVENQKCSPADIAVFRVDFRTWLDRLTPRQRSIALRLGAGESTTELAGSLRVTLGRVSQMRAFLRRSWESFQGEPVAA